MPIIHYGNPLLRKRSEKIGRMDSTAKDLAQELVKAMLQYHGMGLAAVQIGIPKRMIAINAELIHHRKRVPQAVCEFLFGCFLSVLNDLMTPLNNLF